MKKLCIIILVLATSSCSVLNKFGKPKPTDGLVPIKNAGFEKDLLGPDYDPKSWHFGLKDWVGYRSGVVNPHDKMYVGGQAPEGTNMAFVSKDGSNLAQTLSEKLAPNRDYELKVLVGKRADADFQHYRVELYAGGKLLAVDNNSLVIAKGEYKESVVLYRSRTDEPAIGQALKINLKVVKGNQVNFDHVRLTSWPTGSGNANQGTTKSVSVDLTTSSGLSSGHSSPAENVSGSGNVSASKHITAPSKTSVSAKNYSLNSNYIKNINNSYWFGRIIPINSKVPVDPTLKGLWSKGAYLHLRQDGKLGFNWNTPKSYTYNPIHSWFRNERKMTVQFGDIGYTFDIGQSGRILTTFNDNGGMFKMTMQAKSKGQQ